MTMPTYDAITSLLTKVTEWFNEISKYLDIFKELFGSKMKGYDPVYTTVADPSNKDAQN